jgi:cell division protein FtsZ
MGGGTGTGAAPVIARAVREQGILTVGVVTKPFHFEGAHRMRLAENGLAELQSHVDTLIVIPNQNLFRLANERTTFADAFRMADQVLHMGVRGVTDLMIMPGLINLDFADIRTVMGEMGKAMMGTGEAEGERRAIDAAEAAINNPLLDDVSMKGARGVLINITGGMDMTLFEVDAAATRIREEVDPDANIIFGSTFDPAMEGRMRVSVVSTGIDAGVVRHAAPAMPERLPEAVREAAPVFRFQAGKQAPSSNGNLFGRVQRRPAVETNPALHLRAAQPAPAPAEPTRAVEELSPPAAPPSQPTAAAPTGARPFPMPQRPGGAPAPRGTNLFERVKELAFARQGAGAGEDRQQPGDARPSNVRREPEPLPASGPGEPHLSFAVHQDELNDIPAFLRRGERVNA